MQMWGQEKAKHRLFSNSQESLETQRDCKIHQAEDILLKCEVSTPLWIGNTEDDSSNTPKAPHCHQQLSAQNPLYPKPEKTRNKDL